MPHALTRSATELVDGLGKDADRGWARAHQHQLIDLNDDDGGWWMEQMMCRDVRHIFNASVVRLNR